ncbi:MAG: 2-oxoacid ferredoxin oxidoreductase [Candidatus Kerfeldbacteria bacterium RIFOXYA2_FULL_38_24]|uniref:2-oxoacid ferredoxin oxidoreductase n=1 Tax=Candidatus Kerfeldbacteria bacterium RIFOXYB2_FULL_38_14 TaxID=1798547 RepID=A0A1G2BID0_9BACT|nr:MAG: 2-oxoacid ferredoxin oxidoreductase [Candidatus Kerfeldbacteria bacterium RIFOXYB2_FULL_38_14]OGY88177.1 MAG: 2-oxoacid ferredoxin oxidoreductase [Candidatus Kerfeldbacteria bacterium RIFOXYA2_FULL_38_24]OGY89197.1 MAG: 2-oxoacid ferredoxin oxidoreductase [Candidatus Kerfeldbacteria bacterium RIFOXYC2_FULL_38_9]
MNISLANLQAQEKITWCPGCGNYGILMAVKKALVALNRPSYETCLVTGVGCSGKFNHFVKTYSFESLHGRSLPVASGICLANHELNVVAVGGDGDGYGIGLNHFLHTMRRNLNFTYIVHNNQIYGLTTGQYSPTTAKGTISASSPFGALEEPVNPIKLALASNAASFVARGFAGDIKQLTNLVTQAMQHRGFSFIDVLQPCVTFNKINTYEFFKKRVYKLEDDKSYDKTNKKQAEERCLEWDKRIATGVYFQADLPIYEDALPALATTPLVKQDIKNIDISASCEEFV